MATEPSTFITQMLLRVREGDEQSRDELVAALYDDLSALAASHLRRETTPQTLDTTALANDALMRLMGEAKASWASRRLFFAHASRIMRNVLTDHARARRAIKRGGDRRREDFAVLLDQYDPTPLGGDELIDLGDALDVLARVQPRAASVLEHRLFMGMTIKQTADVLEISETTVEGDQRLGLAFLRAKLAPHPTD